MLASSLLGHWIKYLKWNFFIITHYNVIFNATSKLGYKKEKKKNVFVKPINPQGSEPLNNIPQKSYLYLGSRKNPKYIQDKKIKHIKINTYVCMPHPGETPHLGCGASHTLVVNFSIMIKLQLAPINTNINVNLEQAYAHTSLRTFTCTRHSYN